MKERREKEEEIIVVIIMQEYTAPVQVINLITLQWWQHDYVVLLNKYFQWKNQDKDDTQNHVWP